MDDYVLFFFCACAVKVPCRCQVVGRHVVAIKCGCNTCEKGCLEAPSQLGHVYFVRASEDNDHLLRLAPQYISRRLIAAESVEEKHPCISVHVTNVYIIL